MQLAFLMWQMQMDRAQLGLGIFVLSNPQVKGGTQTRDPEVKCPVLYRRSQPGIRFRFHIPILLPDASCLLKSEHNGGKFMDLGKE